MNPEALSLRSKFRPRREVSSGPHKEGAGHLGPDVLAKQGLRLASCMSSVLCVPWKGLSPPMWGGGHQISS